ncbi:hypothetical protein PMAYCL1PPCAC_20719, partial [Pristionchus mayeri]
FVRLVSFTHGNHERDHSIHLRRILLGFHFILRLSDDLPLLDIAEIATSPLQLEIQGRSVDFCREGIVRNSDIRDHPAKNRLVLLKLGDLGSQFIDPAVII